ncbi:MAG TPA: phosphoribosylanthranilate isomerase [bacterium]|nr:phosphoribosylanthranilate isomerase [bacterium]
MTKIKICGFTRRKDIEDAIDLGIKWIGLNFYEKSPRYISEKEAKVLIENLPSEVKKIGVFVNPDEKLLFEYVRKLNLDGAQLHGNEPPSLVKRFKKIFPDKILIKGIRVKNEGSLNKIKNYKFDYLLIDAFDEKLSGGTGKLINYKYLDRKDIPFARIFLAGGITPENVKDIIKRFSPYGIDVASGVEIAPGIKIKEKMKKLVEEVRNAFA